MEAADWLDDSGLRDEPAPRTTAIEQPPTLAWERVEAGRYRPRRIRGSFPGRELG